MNSRRQTGSKGGPSPLTALATGLLALMAAVGPLAQADARAEASQLYEAGNYAAALPLLEKLEADGTADGSSLYRLYFCRAEAGSSEANATLRKALDRLEKELAGDDGSLEAAFYLANGYGNLAQHSERTRVAQAAVDAVDAGRWPAPTDPVARFRLGKLYGDLERNDEAAEWYTRALEGLDPEQPGQAAYARWSHRFLAERARARGDRDAVLEHSVSLIKDPASTQSELDALAVSLVQSLRYRDAALAWAQAVLRAPATGNRARYANRLAITAQSLAPLPDSAADGRAWSELSRQELETVMQDQATRLRELHQQIAEGGEDLGKPQRREIAARMAGLRPLFTAAALEFLVRGFPLRETAFQGGYATLIFRDQEWRPVAPKRRKRGTRKAAGG